MRYKVVSLKEHTENIPKIDFERFRKCFNGNPKDCIMLLKKWLRGTKELDAKAIKAVSFQLEDEELETIYKQLTQAERELWRALLMVRIEPSELGEANKYIAAEVIREMVDGTKIKDLELIDLLIGLTDQHILNFVEEKKSQAGILMNLLSPSVVARVMDQLHPIRATELMELSFKFQFSDVKDEFAAFKDVLKTFFKMNSPSPFGSNLCQILPLATPEKEQLIYGQLARTISMEELKKIGYEQIPSAVVGNLPKEFLKLVLTHYPMNKKVRLILSLDDEMQNFLLDAFADKGTTSREMIDLEMTNTKSTPGELNRISLRKAEYWTDFVGVVREFVLKNAEFKNDIEFILLDWFKTLLPETQNNEKKAA
ncbi:MAG: hypothetical protein ACOYL6_08150 [Bacteriovoracaceae bacterium]